MEEAEYEKDGEVRRYRKVRLTDTGRELRAGWASELLLSDGVVEEFGGRGEGTTRGGRGKAGPAKTVSTTVSRKNGPAENGLANSAPASDSAAAPVRLTAEGEAVVARLRAWRAAEAKRLGVPAFVVLHDRTLTALAGARPGNATQLLAIDGIGPAKAEKFGTAILGLCTDGPVK
jgi:superfamily II DNA helicase RecQ